MTDEVRVRDLLSRLRDNVAVLRLDAAQPLERLESDVHAILTHSLGDLESFGAEVGGWLDANPSI